MTTTARVIAHSTKEGNLPLVTIKARYPRIIHSELMTHRVFSRNSASSRAIPMKRMISEVWNNMFIPTYWGKNQSGMQAKEELEGWRRSAAIFLWVLAGRLACILAWLLYKVGAHKQLGNRILEPFSYITVLISSTHWANFFELRNHADAQPEIKELAQAIIQAIEESTPRTLKEGEWHLPFVTNEERSLLEHDTLLSLSIARCASVSYETVDGQPMTVDRAKALGAKLLSAQPLHASPAEHQAYADGKTRGKWREPYYHGNFTGWCQYRKTLSNENFND